MRPPSGDQSPGPVGGPRRTGARRTCCWSSTPTRCDRCISRPSRTPPGPSSGTSFARPLISNSKTWLRSTFRGISHKHLRRYLVEFACRFNRRSREDQLLPSSDTGPVRTDPLPRHWPKDAAVGSANNINDCGSFQGPDPNWSPSCRRELGPDPSRGPRVRTPAARVSLANHPIGSGIALCRTTFWGATLRRNKKMRRSDGPRSTMTGGAAH